MSGLVDSFAVVQEMYNTLWVTFDFAKFEKLFAKDANISYNYNDQPTKVELTEFLKRMKNGHFDNVTSVKVLQLSIERSEGNDELFLTSYRVETDRRGLGRDETGPGKYTHLGRGGVTTKDGLITSFDFAFEKKKL